MDKEKTARYLAGLSNYYRGLAESEAPHIKSNSFIWNLGLLLATRLLIIARSPESGVEELKLIVKILEGEDFGTEWFELTLQAGALLKIMETEKPQVIEQNKI